MKCEITSTLTKKLKFKKWKDLNFRIIIKFDKRGDLYMGLFDYIDKIVKPTMENIRVIYKTINVKYDSLIDMAVEPDSEKYKKWMQTLNCLKVSENIIINCIENDEIDDYDWLDLKFNIYRFQVKYGGLKNMKVQ